MVIERTFVVLHPDRPGEALLGGLAFVEWIGPPPAKTFGVVNAAVLRDADGEAVAAAASPDQFR